MLVPTYPRISELRSWTVRIGHALVAVSGYTDYSEFGWFMEMESQDFDVLKINKSERRCGLMAAPFALSVYNTGPNSLQEQSTEKDTTYVDAGGVVLLSGRHIAQLSIEHYKTDISKKSFTTSADMCVLASAGD